MRIRVELIAAGKGGGGAQGRITSYLSQSDPDESAEQAQKANTEKADDPGAGVDTSKIVNLMAGDQTRVSTIGFVMLLVGWPLNSYVVRRRVRMRKGEMKARDGRMSMVKFTKFFAWEERWIKRALDAREVETNGMIKCACPPEIRYLSLHIMSAHT
ncbi:hypothetical protein B0H14DRAFT_3573526 [Mycena olivaceomarginata]|nr:hypothetical protein B0H14DRAFT_3573526 [Mycena olivaceomarginata]